MGGGGAGGAPVPVGAASTEAPAVIVSAPNAVVDGAGLNAAPDHGAGARAAANASRAIIAAASSSGTPATAVTVKRENGAHVEHHAQPKVTLKSVAHTSNNAATLAAESAVRLARSGVQAYAVDGHDDLQQIDGIGPVVAAQLQAIGVNRIDDIASWNHEDVNRIDEVLAIKGRIDREDWIGQARALVANRMNRSDER